jgi:hypothetical protein
MASFVVNLEGGGQMTVNASSPAAAVANVIAEGGTPKAGASTVQTPASAAAGQTPAFSQDLSTAFAVLVLVGVAIAVSAWKPGAHIVQFGLVVAILIVIVRDEPQIVDFLGRLRQGNA